MGARVTSGGGAGRSTDQRSLHTAALRDQRSDWSSREGARRQTRFPSAPSGPFCGRAHVRAPGARACASSPFGRPLRRRASRSRLGPRARPPAVFPRLDAARGPPVRSGAGREGRRPGRSPEEAWGGRRGGARSLAPAEGPLPPEPRAGWGRRH